MTGYIKPNLSDSYQMLFFPHRRAREKSSVVYQPPHGKPVGSRLGQMYGKFKTGNWISCQNHVYRLYHLHKSVPLTGKRPRRPETGIKLEHEFPFGAFRPEKKKTEPPFQLFHCFRKFTTGTTKKVLFHLLFNQIFRFVNGKKPLTLSFGGGGGEEVEFPARLGNADGCRKIYKEN